MSRRQQQLENSTAARSATLPRGQQLAGRFRPVVYMKITGATQDGSNLRWSYTVAQVEKTAAGFGNWGTLSGGQTGTAYNFLEIINGTTGVQGNGVNETNLPGTFTAQRIPNNVVVPCWIVQVGTTVEYWFAVPNGVDGACE